MADDCNAVCGIVEAGSSAQLNIYFSNREPPEPRRRDASYVNFPTTSVRTRRVDERVHFDRNAIVRAALRAYIENVLARLDPLDRHPFAASFIPQWTGDLKQGAFRNGDTYGSYEVVAWSDAGVVGLAYEFGYQRAKNACVRGAGSKGESSGGGTEAPKWRWART